jgi:hypothetical protein
MIVKEGALLYQGVGGPMVSPIYLPLQSGNGNAVCFLIDNNMFKRQINLDRHRPWFSVFTTFKGAQA